MAIRSVGAQVILQRLPGWQQAFADFMAERNARPFKWGENDCCLFAADDVRAITGTDPAERLRGYKGFAGAQRLIARAGGLRELVIGILGEPLAPTLARQGDVGLVTQPCGLLTVAVHGGAGWHAPAAGEGGLAWLPAHMAQCAWRIG